MGISGLTRFITGETQNLLKDFRLHDTSLIIDGSNVLHFLYHRFQVSCHFGGDYDTFEAKCNYFFGQLAECNIRPFVVLDGAHDPSGRKWETIMARTEESFKRVAQLLQGEDSPVLPLFARDTFVGVLKARRIPHITYEFEADNQIAALAIKQNCPVLTDDSDFFIFNIPEGIVPLRYVNFVKVAVERDNNEGNYTYMQVKIYYVAGLMSRLSTNESKTVALFATVLGNDTIDGRTFMPFLTDLFRNNGISGSRKRHEEIGALIKWFQRRRYSTHAKRLDHILSFIQPDDRIAVGGAIDDNVKCYTDFSCALTIVDDHFEYSATKSVDSFSGKPLPQWYLAQIEKSEIPVSTLNVVTQRRRVLYCQVEKMNSPSSHRCSVRLRRFMYAILLSVDADSETDKQGLCVDEYDRKYKALECIKTTPLWSLDDGRRVPCLEEIPDLDEHERQSLLLDVLQMQRDALMTYPSEVRLLIATMVFWIKNASPKVGLLHLEALLVCCVKLGILRDALKKIAPALSDDAPVLSDNSMAKLEEFNRQYTKGFDEEIIHAFAQFQSCLESSIGANKLLRLPFPSPDPARIFNGTFLCNFYRKLLLEKEPKAYVDELLGKDTLTATAFAELRAAVRSLCPPVQTPQTPQTPQKEEWQLNCSLMALEVDDK